MAGSLDRQLSHAKGVRAVVRATAAEIATRATANLAPHKGTGASRITVEHGAVDSLVVLDDPASLSIEYGRSAYTRADGHHVGAMEGLHVLGRAIRG